VSDWTGTGLLLRHLLRRERFAMPAWILLLVGMVVGTLPHYARVFSTEPLRQSFAEFVHHNTLMLAFGGQLSSSRLESLAAWKIGDILYSLLGLMTLLLVVRHTRAEEESGRLELLAAGGIGRFAPLSATLLLACGASVLTGLLSALGWIALGSEPAGALAFGGALAAPGCVFAAVAALAAQLGASTRMAEGMALASLGVGYVLRFVADGSGRLWLRWLSPQGWSHLVQPFADIRWWVLGVPLLVTLVFAGAAHVLVASRDLGSGVLPSRPAPEDAPGPRSPLALAWRLQRGMLLGWMSAFALLGAFVGDLARGMNEVGGQNPWWRELVSRYGSGPEVRFSDLLLWVMLLSLGYIATIYPLLVVLRLRSEEEQGRAELVLSTAVGRVRWAASHLVFVVLGPVAVMAASGITLGLAHGNNTGELALQLSRSLAGALIQVPAVWVIAGVTVFAYGVVPRFTSAIGWTAFLFISVFGEVLGPILGIDYAVANQAVPFHHLPRILSGGELTVTPLLVLTGLSAILGTTGVLVLRRRDLA
jgi:ABC-2 type transport system permease protein